LVYLRRAVEGNFLYRAKRSWSLGFEASNCKFPYECLRVPGRSALATWKKLKLDGRGVPIVLGDDYSFDTVLRHLYVARTQSWMSKDELLVKANEMNLRVLRPPVEKAEALELAREHYDFCRAFFDLDEITLSQMAAELQSERWWSFVWVN
jgi:Domain of unknown function (DUF4253)